MKPLASLALFVSAFALALAHSNKSSNSRAPADAAAIRAASKASEQACAQRDWPAVLNIFTDDIVFMPPSGAVRNTPLRLERHAGGEPKPKIIGGARCPQHALLRSLFGLPLFCPLQT